MTLANSSHFIEIDWQAATGAGANNGSVTLWLDGVQQGQVSAIDNDALRVEQARLGVLAGETVAAFRPQAAVAGVRLDWLANHSGEFDYLLRGEVVPDYP